MCSTASPRSGRQRITFRSVCLRRVCAVARYAGLEWRLMPATQGCAPQGSRTRPGLHAVARYAGLSPVASL
jgi:hypothetical protein